MSRITRFPLVLIAALAMISFANASASTEPVRVSFEKLSGFTPQDRLKLDAAAVVLERTLSSPEFREAVLAHAWQEQPAFANNDGLSNEQVYLKIMAGREFDSSIDDHTLNLSLTQYKPPFWKKWSVVGYTYPDTNNIWLNHYYFQSYEPAEVAANLAHEWCHKLGFGHDFRETARRPFSVPYAIGKIVERLGKRL